MAETSGKDKNVLRMFSVWVHYILIKGLWICQVGFFIFSVPTIIALLVLVFSYDGVSQAATSYPVWLENRREGDLLLYNEDIGDYLPICDIHWSLKNADVACRQLGFTQAAKRTYRSYFSHQTFDFSNFYFVDCNGTEDDIQLCGRSNDQACPSGTTAGVSCVDETVHSSPLRRRKFAASAEPQWIMQLVNAVYKKTGSVALFDTKNLRECPLSSVFPMELTSFFGFVVNDYPVVCGGNTTTCAPTSYWCNTYTYDLKKPQLQCFKYDFYADKWIKFSSLQFYTSEKFVASSISGTEWTAFNDKQKQTFNITSQEWTLDDNLYPQYTTNHCIVRVNDTTNAFVLNEVFLHDMATDTFKVFFNFSRTFERVTCTIAKFPTTNETFLVVAQDRRIAPDYIGNFMEFVNLQDTAKNFRVLLPFDSSNNTMLTSIDNSSKIVIFGAVDIWIYDLFESLLVKVGSSSKVWYYGIALQSREVYCP